MPTLGVGTPIGGFPDGTTSGTSTEGCDAGGLSTDSLLDAANAPGTMKSDNQEVTERSLSELIELDKYLRARRAACAANTVSGVADPFAGLKFGIISPPGARGRQ